MSASLVGSEMCIRDSLLLHGGGPRVCLKIRGRPRSRRARWHSGARRGAVSYTHLTLPTICSV
eukprot:3882596-Alexandrium_andersonii.AAC.1